MSIVARDPEVEPKPTPAQPRPHDPPPSPSWQPDPHHQPASDRDDKYRPGIMPDEPWPNPGSDRNDA